MITTPLTTGAHARHSAQPRRRILDAAALVFAEYGFSAAGVDEIARRAKVNKAMLYYYVGDKATLFREVVLEVIEQIKAELAAAVAASSDPRERLAAVPMAFARVASKRPYFPQIMLREVAAGGVHLSDEMLAEITGVVAFTRQVVENGKRQGVFREINPLIVHLMLVGSLLFIANATRIRERIEHLQPLPPDTPSDLASAARAIAKIILEGVAKPKVRRARS
jgi:TetR/AcrR family transcriptional regulator